VTSVPPDMDIHQRVRIARNYAGFSLAEFAEAVGVTYEAARSWEAGESQPRPGRYAKIAEATGTTEAWMASGTGPLTTEETDDEHQKAEAFASAFLGLSEPQAEIILKLIEEFQKPS
jgi:transcriptional regulator with XRE-family HTH domain